MFLLSAVAVLVSAFVSSGPERSPTDRWGRPVGTHANPIEYRQAPRTAPISKPEVPLVPIYSRQSNGLRSSAFGVNLEWMRWSFGRSMGDSGIEIADLDGDGLNEIVCAASRGGIELNKYWYVTERTPLGEYEHTFVSPFLNEFINCIRLFDYNGDGKLDIVIGATNKVYVYDGPTKVQLAQLSTTATSIRGLSFADVQGTTEKEFLFVDSSDLYVYSAAGVLLQKVTGKGGDDMAVGNVLPDRTPEIVIGKDNAPGYVLHGRTRAVIESYPQSLGTYIRLADVDGDEIQELIAGQARNYISLYRVGISRTAIWNSNFSLYIDAVKIADVEGDGIPDIVAADDQWAMSWSSMPVRVSENGHMTIRSTELPI